MHASEAVRTRMALLVTFNNDKTGALEGVSIIETSRKYLAKYDGCEFPRAVGVVALTMTVKAMHIDDAVKAKEYLVKTHKPRLGKQCLELSMELVRKKHDNHRGNE